MTANITTTDPIVYGINYHAARQQGATSNPGSVQARIDRYLATRSAHQGDSHSERGTANYTPTADPGSVQARIQRSRTFIHIDGYGTATTRSADTGAVVDDAAAERKFWQTEHLFDHVI